MGARERYWLSDWLSDLGGLAVSDLGKYSRWAS